MTRAIDTPDQYEAYRREAFDFLWNEVEPQAAAMERGEVSAETLFPRFAELDLFGLIVPRDFGGLGLTTTQYLPFLAEFSKVSGVVRVLLHVHGTSARAVDHYGTEEQRAALLPAIASGQSSLTFAITEPNSGTGMDIGMTATKDGDEWVVNGAKHYITNADFADQHLVCGRTGEPGDRRGRTALVIPTDTPGFTIDEMPQMMGNNGPYHGVLNFDNARVPLDSLIGAEGDGLDVFLGELEPSRVFVAASSLGTAERALEIALDFSKQRVTFGKAIGKRPSVQAELAEMARDTYALRLVLDDCASKLDADEPCALEASIAKLLGLETVMRVTDKALDVVGGRAYFADYPYPLERLYRESRINALEEGTPSIQRLVMARALLAEDVPLKIGTLGEPYQPTGTDPALGKNPPQDLSYSGPAG
ncbi:MAG: acyl-CoA dehydrogenase family protein [Gaiellaceae bacterium]